MVNGKAQAAKEKGNAAFKAGDYPGAIGHYTAAIMADRHDHTFPLNRAAAYLKLGKHEDAERDCTTVLSLNAMNVKALFRRGQARAGMGKLNEALQDLGDALKREPSNGSVKEEIKKVSALLEKQRTKTSKTPITVPPTDTTPAHPKRRRVPITIVEDGKRTTLLPPETQPATAPKTAAQPAAPRSAATPTSPVAHDALTPVSSRSLKTAAKSKTPPGVPEPTATTTAAGPAKPEPPRSFKDAKEARASAKLSRVGGGIFRASGDNKVVPTRGGDTLRPSATPEVSRDDQVRPATKPKIEEVPHVLPPAGAVAASLSVPTESRTPFAAPGKLQTTLVDFSRAWNATAGVQDRWKLISSIHPANLAALFKTSLEPELLVSVLRLFHALLQQATDEQSAPKLLIREYMDGFASVPRFSTVVLFLSQSEKELARSVWQVLGVSGPEGVAGAWRFVW